MRCRNSFFPPPSWTGSLFLFCLSWCTGYFAMWCFVLFFFFFLMSVCPSRLKSSLKGWIDYLIYILVLSVCCLVHGRPLILLNTVRNTKINNIYDIVLSSVSSDQLLSCVWFWDPVNRSTPGLPVHHQLLEPTQTHVHWVGDAIQPSHSVVPFSCLQSFPASGLFQWVNSSHQLAKILELQLQHQSFQWTLRTDFL